MKVFGQFTRWTAVVSAAAFLLAPVAEARPHKKKKHAKRHAHYRAHSMTTYRAPLMPAREWEGVNVASAASTAPVTSDALTAGPVAQPAWEVETTDEARETASSRRRNNTYSNTNSSYSGGGSSTTSSDSFRFGASLGVLAHEGALPYDSLNSQLFYGGRVQAMAPLIDRVWIRPSLGYFLRSQSSTYGSATQNIIEGAANVQYGLIANDGFKLLGGLTQSVQMSFQRISGTMVSNTTGMTFSYHVGPSLGLVFDLTPGFAITVDSEATWDFSSPFAPYIGLTGGVLFRL